MEENLQFDIHIKPSFKKFYSSDSTYGIYSATVNDDSPNKDLLSDIDNMYKEINVVGSMPELKINDTYIATVMEKEHKKFGKQYEVKTIYRKPFTTREEQLMFMGTLLTEKQLEVVSVAYPNENLIDMFKEDKIDASVLKGIGDKTLEKIKKKIDENEKYQLAIIELTGKFNIPYKAVKRLSDKYGSPDTLLQKINQNPYLLTEVDGFGFVRVDEIALQMGVEKTSENRIVSCVEYILDEQANDGHSWARKTKVISDSIKLLGVKIVDIQNVLEMDKKRPFKISEGRIYLEKYYEYENGIAGHVQRLLNSKSEYIVENIDEKIKDVEGKQGFVFTDEQREAIHSAINNNIFVISGKGGSGKTSIVKGIIEVLKTIDGLEYATCALSGKASQRIMESTGLESSTMHRLLGYNPNMGWLYDEDNPLGQDVIILDESSMVNSQLFFYLIRAVKNGGKLIILGDVGQLEAIGVGNILSDLLNHESIPSVELTVVHRQAQKSGILSCANTVRDGNKFIGNNDYGSHRLGELKDLYLYSYDNSDKILNTVLGIAKKYNDDIMDFQVVVPMKSRGKLSTRNLNNELQKIFNKPPEEVDKKRKIERKYDALLEGDKVIITGNNYDKNLYNGTVGIIEYIDMSVKDGEIVINFEGSGNISFKKEEMKQIELAYALTIHKVQGSQYKYVVMALDYASYVLLNRQSTYTGMTRAINALFLVVELKALQYSIDTDKSSKRNTFLKELLSSAK